MKSKIIVPSDILDFLEIEDCSDFNVNRYFKTKCQDEIFDAIVRANTLSVEMKSLGIKYPNTTLLYGPSGTGKTTFGRYVAYRLNLDFAYISFSSLVGSILGDTAKNLTKVFRFMENQNCVFMLDEIDCIAVDRINESQATGGELSRITITLMQELDRLKKYDSKLIVIAATNVFETMDNALKTRFSVKRCIDALTAKEKQAFIKMYLDNLPVEIDYDLENIKDYSSKAVMYQQRTIEADIVLCLASFIENGKKGFYLKHIEEGYI